MPPIEPTTMPATPAITAAAIHESEKTRGTSMPTE
jgi:hypothetical protein